MSRRDLDEAIHHTERASNDGLKVGRPQFVSEDLPTEQRGTVRGIDIAGRPTDDQRKCAAKVITDDDGHARFFVKFCVDGPDKGHFLNPYSIYYHEGDDRSMALRRGQHRYEFRKVAEPVFQSYVNFLKTRTFAYCQAAEREYLNA